MVAFGMSGLAWAWLVLFVFVVPWGHAKARPYRLHIHYNYVKSMKNT